MTRAAGVFRKAAVAFQAGDVRRAESLCRKTRGIAPAFYGASLMLGLLLKRRGAIREAAEEFVRAAKLAPNDFSAHYEAGAALTHCGNFGQAIVYLGQACALEPASFEARSDLGSALRLAGRSADAIAHYREALCWAPEHALGYSNLGAALCDLRQFDEALGCFDRAIALAPTLADAHHNRGNVLKELGRVSEAVRAYQIALELRPNDRSALSNLLFAMMFDPASDASTILEWAKLHQSRHLALSRAETLPPASRSSGGRRLRIGYVCADFRDHVFMMLLPQLIRDHNRDAFEVYLYSNLRVPDTVTQLYVEYADHFRPIADLDDRAAANVIRNDRIDILLDITMHMAHGRLGIFARRPAPVQVTWLAYPGTTGAECIDFRLSDPHLDPPGTDAMYSERTARLPESFWCYAPSNEGLAVSALPALERGFITFGCLNTFCKTNEQTFSLWARVLRALPTSHLLMLTPSGSARERTGAFFEREGVSAQRLEFVDIQSRTNYLETYSRIDVVLDTLPYNGHTTSLDALWMGVPVVTLVGNTVVGRAGLSLSKNLGMEELCADTPEDFCTRAVALASDLEGLATLRATLRARLEHSPLMDSPRFALNFEQTLLGLYRDIMSER